MHHRTYTVTIFILLYVFFINTSFAQEGAFITEWKTDNPGSSCDKCVTIPTSSDDNYNYTVDLDHTTQH